MRSLAAATIVSAAALGATAQASCTSFGGKDDPTSPDGGADATTGDAGSDLPRERDVEVSVDWPAVAALDPSKRPNAGGMLVVLTDAADKSRTASREVAATERGPFVFSRFLSSSAVDVVLEIRNTPGLLVGYGERRRADLSLTPRVTVAARRRVLYVATRDRPPADVGTLRTLDLAPPQLAEPSVAEATDVPPLELVPMGVSLYVTGDGLRLVEAGGPSSGEGTIGVFRTGTHAREKTITLPFRPAVMAPIGDGHTALVFPQASSATSIAAVVDIDRGTASPIQTGITAGTIVASSIAVHPSGSKIFVAAEHRSGANRTPYLFVYEGGKISANVVQGMSNATAVRFLPDGSRAVIAGFVPGGGTSAGVVVTLDANAPAGVPKALFDSPSWEPFALTIDREGKFAHVSGTNCCQDMITIELASGQQKGRYVPDGDGPRYQLVSALELPYEPRRIFAGQSDPANNGRSTLVEVVAGGVGPVDVNLANNLSFGSFHAMASPFARAR